MADTSDERSMKNLQKSLHSGNGPLPKLETVKAAAAMVRDPSLRPSQACDDAGVPRGSRSRAVEYRDRISKEHLLEPPDSALRRDVQKWIPHVVPPICHSCESSAHAELIMIENPTKFPIPIFCMACKTMLPCVTPKSTSESHWTCWNCAIVWSEVEEIPCAVDGAYFDVLCHSCSGTSVVDWHDRSLAWVYKMDRFDLSNFGLTTCSVMHDDDCVDESYDQQEELRIAQALQLPCNTDKYLNGSPVCPLLVMEEWIEENAPRIEFLKVGRFTLSDDGKTATRRLTAELREGDDDAERDYFLYDERDVDYEMPLDHEHGSIQRWRRNARFRGRELEAIRFLDGTARAP